MRIRSVLCASALVVAAGFATAAPAMAGPGSCDFPPGRVISEAAHSDGPVAGPNSGITWGNPNAPGQAITAGCQPGNSNH